MKKTFRAKTIFLLIAVVGIVVCFSLVSNRLWGGKPETLPKPGEWVIRTDMTITDFGRVNGLSNPALREIFDLKTKSDLEKALSTYGTNAQVQSRVVKKLALIAEHDTKNWVKILIKFLLWFILLAMLFLWTRKRKLDVGFRKWLLFAAVLIFGVVMGSDPSPMGTVKDAIHLYGSAGAVFPPRMIALTAFLLMVFAVNKYICAWGCQMGVLQDLMFRMNQVPRRKAVIGRQIKPPFVLTNGIRILFLCLFTVGAFGWGADIIEPIDPFKIYKPGYLGVVGGIFIGMLLMVSLFIYRPWCHFLCPFGLAGWLVEKISRVKISVDYDTCIACEKCVTACPSTVMGAILKRDKKTIPDCFACYTCRDVCPTASIRFSTRKRSLPPSGHFDRKKQLPPNQS